SQDNKIRAFVNSLQGAGLPVRPVIGSADQRSGFAPDMHRYRFSIFERATSKTRVVRVSKYNRFSLACKPPASNELQPSGQRGRTI
ncbi:MAG TPA: hypothetical protein VGD27_05790, partial [Longimicrobiales bacterium]